MNRLQHLRAAIMGSESGGRNPADEKWWLKGDELIAGGANQVPVTASSVMQIPEAYDCLLVISQAVAMLPLITYERASDGSKSRADGHPIADLLHHRANDMQTAYEFRGQMTWDLCLHRNAYAEIRPGARGPIDSLWRLDPDRMVLITDGRDHVYEYVEQTGEKRRMDPMQVFHLRALPLTSDNLLGRSLLKDGRRTFARALAIQEYAQAFFENDATPGGVITMKDSFKNKEQADDLRRRWFKMFGDAKQRHMPAVLDGVSDYKTVPVQNDKAQFIETYQKVALQIARLWRMPPHKIGILDNATFSNIEQQSLEFVVDTLMPWLTAWEQAIRRDLILNRGRFYCEHNVAGLLRGDLKSRYDAYAIGRNWGWLSVNDIRSMENMNPLPTGDVYLQPLNMAPAGSDSAEDAAFEARLVKEATITRAVEALRPPQRLIELKPDATAEEAT